MNICCGFAVNSKIHLHDFAQQIYDQVDDEAKYKAAD